MLLERASAGTMVGRDVIDRSSERCCGQTDAIGRPGMHFESVERLLDCCAWIKYSSRSWACCTQH